MKSFAVLLAMVLTMGGANAARYDVAEKDIATLQADLSAGRVTSEQLTRAYLERIDKLDRSRLARSAG